MKQALLITLMMVIGLLITGCDEEGERLAEYAQQSTAEQAKQNRSTAELARDATENQRRMVESVEQSRQDLVGLQETLDGQRTAAEAERRELADARNRDSLLVPVLSSVGLLLVTALPLVLCWYLLHGLQKESTDDNAVNQLLIQELVAEQPLLLPGSRMLAPHIEQSVPEDEAPKKLPPF